MSGWEYVVLVLYVLVCGGLMWLHGFNRGREDMRRQVVCSLRFGAQLRRVVDPDSDKAQVLDAWADRLERQGPL